MSKKYEYEYFKERYENEISMINEMHMFIAKIHQINYIYFIQNNITKKIYIGRSIYGVEQRFKQHIEASSRTKSDVYNTPLSEAIRKYGASSFKIGYLDCVACKKGEYKKANDLEQNYIKELETLYPNGYNLSGLKGNDLKVWRDTNNG